MLKVGVNPFQNHSKPPTNNKSAQAQVDRLLRGASRPYRQKKALALLAGPYWVTYRPPLSNVKFPGSSVTYWISLGAKSIMSRLR